MKAWKLSRAVGNVLDNRPSLFARASFTYFGQPSGGFFFCKDCFMASGHLPQNPNTSGFGALGPRFG